MTLVDNTYRYDGNANCIEKHTLSGLNRYTYDSLGQLVKAEYPTVRRLRRIITMHLMNWEVPPM